jgi:hypothetical protein
VAYWWVNHKQTYRQETDGGYVWSPKANANGAKNVSYDNLTRCLRGDVVFSYANGKISQIGLGWWKWRRSRPRSRLNLDQQVTTGARMAGWCG